MTEKEATPPVDDRRILSQLGESPPPKPSSIEGKGYSCDIACAPPLPWWEGSAADAPAVDGGGGFCETLSWGCEHEFLKAGNLA